MGAIYDPLADAWTSVAPPTFFGGFGPFPQTIGDAQSVVLANGTYMQADCCTNQDALLDPKTLTWTATGPGKFDIHDEEGWTLLPNKQVLTVDAYVGQYNPTGMNSEFYNPASGKWHSAGSTAVQLWDSAANCGGTKVASFEVGPAVLRPDGTVFYTGANSCGAGHTAIYNSNTGTWTAGPDFPDTLDIADGPASLLPNGNVLLDTSPGIFNPPTYFFEFDGSNLNPVTGPPNASGDTSFFGNMLILPTGQILFTDFSNDIEIYTSTGTYNPAWAPRIDPRPPLLVLGIRMSFPAICSTGSRKGRLTGTMSKLPRTILWCVSPTGQLGTFSTAGRMTTAAWPSRSGASCPRISMCRPIKSWASVT